MSRADEPAFPTETGNSVAMNGTVLGPGITSGGLTKREYFAGLAMQGLSVACIPGSHNSDNPIENREKAKHAVNLADALLAELEKKGG